MSRRFTKFARKSAQVMGSPKTFVFVTILTIAWIISGFVGGFGDSWLLIGSTTATLFTTLMVLLVQNTQNHDSAAIHLKLNEMIRADNVARNQIIGMENCQKSELKEMQQEFIDLRREDGNE